MTVRCDPQASSSLRQMRPSGWTARVLSMRLSWSRRWDIALAAVGAVALLVDGSVRAKAGLSPGAYALAFVSAAPLAWRGRAPLAALFAVEAGAVACVFAFDATWAASGVVAVMLFTVALHGDRVRSVAVGALTAIAVVLVTVVIDGAVDLGQVVIRLALLFLSLALGDTIRSRRALRAAALEREAREEREREQESRRRLTNERLRIARELHDTLAHALVAINVRAGVANHLGGAQDPSVLQDIKAVSATALGDLPATLTLLREDDDAAPTEPAFELEALPSLADHVRAAGLEADVDIQAGGAAISSTVGQAAFRIVQEALTNVLRHAEASSASVHVRTISDALEIEVIDDGRGDASPGGTGYGLLGMTERAAALGGTVETGPRRDGGWRVHAVLPLSGRSSK
jgi:signal transduction histidine kinase